MFKRHLNLPGNTQRLAVILLYIYIHIYTQVPGRNSTVYIYTYIHTSSIIEDWVSRRTYHI